MQISSPSPRTSYRSQRSSVTYGFTLIELLISAAIITIVTSIVLVRFNAFDSTVLLKSLAYEVGTSVREAQIYSVSVVNMSGSSSAFRYPYGLHFIDNDLSYTFFSYNDTGTPGEIPTFSGPDPVTSIRTLPFGSSLQLRKICAVGSGIACTQANADLITSVDISFRRPEFAAIFYSPSLTPQQRNDTTAIQLYLGSTRDTSNIWVVEVKLLGQISVYRCTVNCT